MSPELVPQPIGRERLETWRGTDFDSQQSLAEWLTLHALDNRHLEPGPRELGSYMHTGYEAFVCQCCGRPSIRGAGRREDRTCGRDSCAR